MFDTVIAGPDATRLLAAVSGNNYESFTVGQAKQFIPVTSNGNIVTDGILHRDAAEQYTLSGIPAAQNWVKYHGDKGGYDVSFSTDPSSAFRGGAAPKLFRYQVQGPLAADLVERAFGGRSANVFAVGGDPATPHGPYHDSLAIIESGLLHRYGVRHVSVSGYPEGHPAIPDQVLWSALAAKVAALSRHRLPGTVITQFGFDADPVLAWIEAVRSRGIELPIRIGVPGPAGVKRLLSYAARFGVGTSAGRRIANGYPGGVSRRTSRWAAASAPAGWRIFTPRRGTSATGTS